MRDFGWWITSSLLADAGGQAHPLNALGALIMIVSIGSVVALTAFCLYRVLTLPSVEIDDLNTAPLEIDTRDTGNAG